MDYKITINNKKYFFDFDKLKSMCAVRSGNDDVEQEITEAYALNDEGDMSLSSKINRELRSNDASEMNNVLYDCIKLFIVELLSEDFNSFSFKLTFNTFLKFGLIREIE